MNKFGHGGIIAFFSKRVKLNFGRTKYERGSFMSMTAEDYRKKAEMHAELLVLAIKEKDFGVADRHLKEVESAIVNMRKKNNGG